MVIFISLIIVAILFIFATQQSKKVEIQETVTAPQSEMADAEGDESREVDKSLGANPIDAPKEKDSKIEALLDSVNTIKYCMVFFVILQVLSIIGGIILVSQIGSLF